MSREEVSALTKALAELEDQARVLLLPRDPLDDKNVLLEVCVRSQMLCLHAAAGHACSAAMRACGLQIRAGTGGDEAALWAADLVRMFTRYASEQRWKV